MPGRVWHRSRPTGAWGGERAGPRYPTLPPGRAMRHPISWSIALPHYVAALAAGYLFGSIPFGLLITRLAGTADLRTIGSGNIGATNVLRTGRWELAVATLATDMLKATVV